MPIISVFIVVIMKIPPWHMLYMYVVQVYVFVYENPIQMVHNQGLINPYLINIVIWLHSKNHFPLKKTNTYYIDTQ